jgi:hypothetical protein
VEDTGLAAGGTGGFTDGEVPGRTGCGRWASAPGAVAGLVADCAGGIAGNVLPTGETAPCATAGCATPGLAGGAAALAGGAEAGGAPAGLAAGMRGTCEVGAVAGFKPCAALAGSVGVIAGFAIDDVGAGVVTGFGADGAGAGGVTGFAVSSGAVAGLIDVGAAAKKSGGTAVGAIKSRSGNGGDVIAGAAGTSTLNDSMSRSSRKAGSGDGVASVAGVGLAGPAGCSAGATRNSRSGRTAG